MKKIWTAAVIACFTSLGFAGNTTNYVIDDKAIEAQFAGSDDISGAVANGNLSNSFSINTVAADAEQTKGGFLIRAFFCGAFALHRSYMGTKGMFIKYFCTFGVIGCAHFWWTVIKGDEAFNKFKGNDKWVVWNN